MKIKDMTKADLELLSYGDIAFLLVTENKKPMNTPTLFKKICSLLEYSDDEYTDKVGDFYTSLTNDKRFIMLDSAEWDLRDNHAVKISLADEDDEDEVEVDEEELSEEDEIEMDESLDDDVDLEEPLDDEELELDDDDDIADLTVIDDEEEMEE